MGDVTRRHLIQAGAWTVPVVAIAVATPAATASTVQSFAITITAAYQGYEDEVPYSVLAGIVRDAGGQPAAGVVLTATFIPSLKVMTNTTTDAGRFVFLREGDAPQDSYRIDAPDGSTTGLRPLPPPYNFPPPT